MQTIASKIQTLPDLAKAFKLLKIKIELGNIVPDNVLTISIAEGLEIDVKGTIEMLKDCIRDNRLKMEEILGNDLLIDIENY